MVISQGRLGQVVAAQENIAVVNDNKLCVRGGLWLVKGYADAAAPQEFSGLNFDRGSTPQGVHVLRLRAFLPGLTLS